MALGLLLNEPVAAVVILIMLTGGEALEDYAMSRAESGIHELLEQEPGTARRILADGSMEEVQATDLAVGDSVMLRTGGEGGAGEAVCALRAYRFPPRSAR